MLRLNSLDTCRSYKYIITNNNALSVFIHFSLQKLVNEVKPRQYFYILPLTFFASTFLYPFGVSNVIMAGFTVKQRPMEEQQQSHVSTITQVLYVSVHLRYLYVGILISCYIILTHSTTFMTDFYVRIQNIIYHQRFLFKGAVCKMWKI